jgi:prepilin-type processing-associated H-X9-DG protein
MKLHTHLLTPQGLTLLQTPIPTDRCPSDTGPALNNFDDSHTDPTAPKNNWYNRHVTSDGTDRIAIALSNYVISANPSDSTTPPVDPVQYGPARGMGFQNSGLAFGSIPDGTSNTILVGERAWRFADLTVGAANALGFSADTCATGSSWSVKSGQLAVLAIAYDGINWRANNRVHQTRGFSSNHTGGAQFVMCDGSVHLISQNIDYAKGTVTQPPYWTTVFARMIVRDDGLVLGDWNSN